MQNDKTKAKVEITKIQIKQVAEKYKVKEESIIYLFNERKFGKWDEMDDMFKFKMNQYDINILTFRIKNNTWNIPTEDWDYTGDTTCVIDNNFYGFPCNTEENENKLNALIELFLNIFEFKPRIFSCYSPEITFKNFYEIYVYLYGKESFDTKFNESMECSKGQITLKDFYDRIVETEF